MNYIQKYIKHVSCARKVGAIQLKNPKSLRTVISEENSMFADLPNNCDHKAGHPCQCACLIVCGCDHICLTELTLDADWTLTEMLDHRVGRLSNNHSCALLLLSIGYNTKETRLSSTPSHIPFVTLATSYIRLVLSQTELRKVTYTKQGTSKKKSNRSNNEPLKHCPITYFLYQT